MRRSSGVLAATVALWSVAHAQHPGDSEKRALREAAKGHLENVFVVRALGGYVAFPRTFVMLGFHGGTNVRLLVDLHSDASLDTSGFVIAGQMVTSKDGTRRDTVSGTALPTAPTRIENRGVARVEYFEPESDSAYPKVLISAAPSYLLLTGSATVVAPDLIATYLALTGPPDVFARHSKPTELEPCDSRIVEFDRVMWTEGNRQWMLRVRAGEDLDAFRQTGFRAGDLVIAVDGRPIGPEDDLRRLLREVAKGREATFSIRRGETRTDLTLQPASARRALAQCSK